MSHISENRYVVEITEGDLPVFAAVAVEAMSLIRQGDPTVKSLEQLIRSDPSLATRILRLANSPLYQCRVTVKTLGQAIVCLGMVNLSEAILVAAISDLFDPRDPYPKAFWEHSVGVGVASQWLSTRLNVAEPDECFVAGLLHDLGKLIIYLQIPDVYATLVDMAARKGKPLNEIEEETISPCSHPSIGAMAGLNWGLNPDLMEVMQYHHQIETKSTVGLEAENLVALVSIANLLVHELEREDDAPGMSAICESVPGKIVGIDTKAIDAAREELPPLIEEQRSLFC